jgi:hypothetical protein
MKRWAVVTVTLYALMMLALTAPLFLFGGAKWSQSSGLEWEWGLGQLGEVMGHWGYWLWLALLLGAQALLLVVPVGLAEQRPKPRRRLWVPLATASFLLANLVFAGGMSILAAVLGDEMDEPFTWLGKLATEIQAQLPVVGLNLDDGFFAMTSALATLAALWLVWGLLFYHYAHADDPEARVKRAVRWLLRGSILELLVAVPSHVVLRCRQTCCAQAATFWGIVTGVSVMLMAFGPGVFFLFAERARRLRPRPPLEVPPVVG